LQNIPSIFPNYDVEEYNEFITCLQYENEWNGRHPFVVYDSEITILENYLVTFKGIALEKLRGLLHRATGKFYLPEIADNCICATSTNSDAINFTESDTSSNSHKSMNSSNNGNKQSLDNAGSYTLTLYPNPSEDVLHLNLENTATVNIQQIAVYDIYGRQLRTKENIDVSKTSISLSGLTNGIYFIHVKMNSGEIKIRRIIKE
jgi:hypothetical protein